MGPADALDYFMTEAVQVPGPALEQMKASPMWAQLLPLAHTIIYDNELMWPDQQGGPLPREWADEVGQVPALVVTGGKSREWMQNAAQATADLLPKGRRLTLEGCDHGAPPETIAAVITDFFGEDN
jgi:hypothetical protein